jgi:lysophospholipase L1-like esterase
MENIKSYLALGDSYTTGTGVNAQESWPVQLAAALRRNGIPMAEPLIIARNGWTTSDLAAVIQEVNPQANSQTGSAAPFDLVSLLIGVNNQYQGLALAAYRPAFADLLAHSIRLAGNDPRRVVVLSIPDWGVTPFADGRDQAVITQEIDAFNAANRAETRAAGAQYVDITPLTRELGLNRFGANLAMFAPDGLHPSAIQYAQWVEQVLDVVQPLLKEPGA